MIKDVLNFLGQYTVLAEIGLLIFLAVFVAVVIRVMTRQRSEVAAWSMLPLEDASVDEMTTGRGGARGGRSD
ncbi:MAG: hypothetical protein ACK4PI_14150 [Tepidisphaerales bacterium]